MGCTAAIVFTCFGAAYGTAKAGVGISAMGVLRPDLIVKSTFVTAQFVKDGWICATRRNSTRSAQTPSVVHAISQLLTYLTDIIPVIMAGIIAIYGLVVSVLISNELAQKQSLYTGFIQLGAGLSVGLAGLAAGFAIGIVGDAGVRGTAQQPRLFVGMILILIFAEVLGKSQHLRHLSIGTNGR